MEHLFKLLTEIRYFIQGDRKMAKELAKIVKVDGQRMTLAERNTRMKLDYINGMMSIQELSQKYGLAKASIGSIVAKNKWKVAKDKLHSEIERATTEKIAQVYAGCSVDITLAHNNTWQKIMNIINDVLNNADRYLVNSNGDYKLGSVQVIAEILEMVQRGQNCSTGFLGKMENMQLELSRQSLQLQKIKAGQEDDEEQEQDNFIECLNNVAEAVWVEVNEVKVDEVQ